MEIEQSHSSLIEKPSVIEIIKQTVNPYQNELANFNQQLYSDERVNLIEELKILIRKLWN